MNIKQNNLIPLHKCVEELKKSPIIHNIVTMIFYGSRLKNESTVDNFSDYDIHLVLKEENIEILTALKKIFRRFKQDLFDISIHYYDEIFNKDKIIFQNGTQGQYFIKILSNGHVLLGENIYKKLEKLLDEREVTRSLIFKIREYTWKIRRLSLQPINKRRSREIIKCFLKILLDILLVNSFIDWKDLQNVHKKNVTKWFIKFYPEQCKNCKIFMRNITQISKLRQKDLLSIIQILSRIKSINKIYE